MASLSLSLRLSVLQSFHHTSCKCHNGRSFWPYPCYFQLLPVKDVDWIMQRQLLLSLTLCFVSWNGSVTCPSVGRAVITFLKGSYTSNAPIGALDFIVCVCVVFLVWNNCSNFWLTSSEKIFYRPGQDRGFICNTGQDLLFCSVCSLHH